MKITTIGLDLAKNVFQVHGVNAEGNVTVQRRLRRKEVLLFFGGLEPVEADDDDSLPTLARGALRPLVAQLRTNEKAIAELDAEIKAWHTQNEMSRRLATIPGVGVLTASAIAATVPDPSFFRSGREFAAWLGLVPRQNSSGGKERLGRISKQGNRYIRRMLVIGATGMLRYARAKSAAGAQWVTGLLERRAPRLVTVAMATRWHGSHGQS